MSDAPQNPREAAEALWALNVEMDGHSRALEKIRLTLPGLARTARLTEAEAFLSSTGSVESRKREAVLAADEAKFALETAEQTIEARRDRLRTLTVESENIRSINSNLKEELRVFGSGSGSVAA